LKKHKLLGKPEIVVENYIDGHKIDYVKGRVALDMEWNVKIKLMIVIYTHFVCFMNAELLALHLLITRSEKLNPVFDVTPLLKKDGSQDIDTDGNPKLCKQKYGASTTWMGKLLYRLNAGRHGGCPVLVFGIRPDVITDWQNN